MEMKTQGPSMRMSHRGSVEQPESSDYWVNPLELIREGRETAETAFLKRCWDACVKRICEGDRPTSYVALDSQAKGRSMEATASRKICGQISWSHEKTLFLSFQDAADIFEQKFHMHTPYIFTLQIPSSVKLKLWNPGPFEKDKRQGAQEGYESRCAEEGATYFCKRQKFVLGVTSLWLLYPLLLVTTSGDDAAFSLHTLLTAMISCRFWYKGEMNNGWHKADRLNARFYFVHLLFFKPPNDALLCLLFLSTIIFFLISHAFEFLEDKDSSNAMYAHILFRKIGFYTVVFKTSRSDPCPSHLLSLTVCYYLHIFYVLLTFRNNTNYSARTVELLAIIFLVFYVNNVFLTC
jgi:hypothetical protein